jgi:hypothetical protein
MVSVEQQRVVELKFASLQKKQRLPQQEEGLSPPPAPPPAMALPLNYDVQC